MLAQTGSMETDRGCYSARSSSHSEVKAAGTQDVQEERFNLSKEETPEEGQ